jgi:hypothetical protein
VLDASPRSPSIIYRLGVSPSVVERTSTTLARSSNALSGDGFTPAAQPDRLHDLECFSAVEEVALIWVF